MWYFVGISGLRCFTRGTWIIIGRPPLETIQSVTRYMPTKRNEQYMRFDGGISMPHCSATDNVRDFFLIGH